MDCVRLALVNLYKVRPKAIPSKQVFLVLFYYSFNNRNPIYKPSTAGKSTEQNRTKLSLFLQAYSEIVVVTVAARQLEGLLLCKNSSKLLTATQATAYSRWTIMTNIPSY